MHKSHLGWVGGCFEQNCRTRGRTRHFVGPGTTIRTGNTPGSRKRRRRQPSATRHFSRPHAPTHPFTSRFRHVGPLPPPPPPQKPGRFAKGRPPKAEALYPTAARSLAREPRRRRPRASPPSGWRARRRPPPLMPPSLARRARGPSQEAGGWGWVGVRRRCMHNVARKMIHRLLRFSLSCRVSFPPVVSCFRRPSHLGCQDPDAPRPGPHGRKDVVRGITDLSSKRKRKTTNRTAQNKERWRGGGREVGRQEGIPKTNQV